MQVPVHVTFTSVISSLGAYLSNSQPLWNIQLFPCRDFALIGAMDTVLSWSIGQHS